jgi:hypothetical protein
MKTLSLRQSFVCLMAVLLTSCVFLSPDVNETASPVEPVIEITSFPSVVTINDIDLEFSGYEITSNYLTINICFESPNKKEIWVFDEVVLKVENHEAVQNQVSAEYDTDREDGFDCGNIVYKMASIPSLGKAELEIGQLETVVDSEHWACDRAQANLSKDKTEIEITCDPSIVGVGSAFRILKKPASMKEEDAIPIVFDAFSNKVEVNWKFSFMIEKQ